MINEKRLADEFLKLAHIESPSKKEGKIASYLFQKFKELGALCLFDNSSSKTGSEVGNLIVKFTGDKEGQAIFFSAHMDTVEPTKDPHIQLKEGIFRSDGRTICGADDKSAIAVFLEVARILREYQISHPPIEFIFTTCEEIGLLGAKNLDYSLIEAPYGYALDSEDPEVLINQAPEAIRFNIKVLGLAAHAGLCPEKGINAIQLASKALSKVKLGRIDEKTTCNIGLIKGGQATNIVPEEVEIQGEIRSHDPSKIEILWENILSLFEKEVKKATNPQISNTRPALEIQKEQDYPLLQIPLDHPLIKLALSAANKLKHPMKIDFTCGGSDANIFTGQGLPCVILGTGMQKVHSTQEYIALKDLIKTAELVLEIIKIA